MPSIESASAAAIRESLFRYLTPERCFVAAIVVVPPSIWLLAGDLGFVADDLDFTSGRIELVEPHNEHWAATTYLVFGLMARLIGTTSYLPFLAAQLVAVAILAAGLFVLLGRSWWAAGASSLMLVLGSGFEAIYWVSTFGLVLSAASGVWALIALRSGRDLAAASLLLVGVASSAFGLAWVAAAFGFRPRYLLIVPLLIYSVWLAVWGINTVASHQAPRLDVVFALAGAGFAVGAASGLGMPLAVILSPLLLRMKLDRLAVAAAIGLAVQVVLVGLGRSDFGIAYAGVPRYVYVAAPFVFILASRIRLPNPAWAFLFLVSLVANLVALNAGHFAMVEQASRWR